MRKIILYWVPVIGWMTFVFYLSSRRSVTVSSQFFIQFLVFKSFHVIEYGILYILWLRALKNTTTGKLRDHRINALIYTIFYGITDEIHQVFVPSREGRMRDILIDAFGASLVALYLWKYVPQAPKILKTLVKKLEIS